MAGERRRVAVIGSPCGLEAALAELGAHGFQFDYLADVAVAARYLKEKSADAVLLSLPTEEAERPSALAWLRAARKQFPVVVVSGEADMRPYLVAMEGGAFDYLTSHTPLAEIERVLTNAARWRQRLAA